jgi:putative membrane protein
MESSSRNDQIQGLRRPHPNLMKYYIVKSFYWGPLIIVGLLYHIFRYRTLHYRFDEEGVGMGWGVLFRREIHLTYSRIQDIHLTSNIVERYLGLARVHIQTASGRAGAEMVIEGLLDFEAVRDHLYSRMRGLKPPEPSRGVKLSPTTPVVDGDGDVAAAMLATAAELREIRRLLGQHLLPQTEAEADE